MEDKYGVIREHSGIWKSLRDGDFDEEEVWSVLNKDTPDKYSHSDGALKIKGSSPIPVPKSSASRMIPRPNSTNNINNNNNNFSSEAKFQFLQQSAPVNIPDWSKIYNTKSSNNNDLYNSGDYVEDYGGGGGSDEDLLDEDYDEYDVNNNSNNKMLLPPHELIARRLARSQISSFSVLEGVGRTLKGRDLSKVRNAVLTKTGFLESL
ncbi:hypothetical protein PIB30_005051 [Stylosanthes scabra]|uniref:Senescence regulator S40 n=1 Tax=Stylosanthes scabra TaxID=79078 RepID=A0ABU6Z3K6_9FABA|nr:hypothetical protein [Stylosanthes scabra]